MPLRLSEEEYTALLARNAPHNNEPASSHAADLSADAAGVLAVALVRLTKRALAVGYWSAALLATMIMYDNYGSIATAGAALLALGLAGMVAPADSMTGRFFAALSQAFWMLFAVFTAIAALHRLGRRHWHNSGIFAHTFRAIVAAITLTLLAAYGASIRAAHSAELVEPHHSHAWCLQHSRPAMTFEVASRCVALPQLHDFGAACDKRLFGGVRDCLKSCGRDCHKQLAISPPPNRRWRT